MNIARIIKRYTKCSVNLLDVYAYNTFHRMNDDGDDDDDDDDGIESK